MSKIILMRGPSGSGKSTWAREFSEAHPGDVRIVSADDYFVRPDGTYRFDARQLDKAHERCKVEFLEAQADNWPFIIVDNTNIRVWTFEVYVAAAGLVGDPVFQKVLGLDLTAEELQARCKHGLREETIRRQIKNFEEWTGAERFRA